MLVLEAGGTGDARRTAGELNLVLGVLTVLWGASHGTGVRHGCEVTETVQAPLSVSSDGCEEWTQ